MRTATRNTEGGELMVVELPAEIGMGSKRYMDGRPCCSLGHAISAFSDEDERMVMQNPEYIRWRNGYSRCAAAHTGVPYLKLESVIAINDRILPWDERPLVYAAAWVYAGYAAHGYPEAEELGRRALQQYPPEENN